MWAYEHSVETFAAPEVLWEYLSDVGGWPRWNSGIERIEFDGPFVVGATFTMTPPGQEALVLRLEEVEAGQSFTDVMDAGNFAVRTTHRLEPLGSGRTRVVYRTEITGPAADEVGPQLGPEITSDFPVVLAALIALAEKAGSSDFSAE